MKIKQTLNNNELTIALEGELNSATAPELDEVISNSLKGIQTLIFEFKDLSYISSAGLRILLTSKKVMDKHGKMIVRNANESVMEIFEITGFANILDFE